MKTTHEFNSSCFEGLWINKCRAFSMRATHEIIEYANPPFNTLLMWNCPKIWTVTEGCWEEAILKIRWMVIDFFFCYLILYAVRWPTSYNMWNSELCCTRGWYSWPYYFTFICSMAFFFLFLAKKNYVSFSVFILMCFLDQKWHGVLATTFSKAPLL